MSNKIDLNNVAGGAAKHLFDHEMQRLLANIKDPNADAKKPRSLTLTFTLKPYTDRRGADISVASSVKLVPVTAVTSNIQIAVDPETQKPVAYSHDVRQEDLQFQKEQELAELRRVAEQNANLATMPKAVNS